METAWGQVWFSTLILKEKRGAETAVKNVLSWKSIHAWSFQKVKLDESSPKTSIGQWVKEQTSSCFICDYYKNTYNRYLDTFFELYRKNPEFRELFKSSKGFCLPHFGDLVETGEIVLSDKEKNTFYPELFRLMTDNLQRVSDDLEWFCDKFDYKNKDADWKNSRDAIQRGMQKAAGSYPADPPYKADK